MLGSALAPLKLNLFLHVGEPLSNGRHPLDSVVVFPRFGDTVTVQAADALALTVSGPFAQDLVGHRDNLVLRAARALGKAVDRAPLVHLTLAKNVPIASGIGGGSADAAATLRVLFTYWELRENDVDLYEIAASLGADVPVCLASATRRMSGTGETLARAPLLPPEIPVVLVNPRVPVSTATVFTAFDAAGLGGTFSEHRFPDCGSMPALIHALGRCRNDLEPVAVALCPEIGDVLAALQQQKQAKLVRMAGSGATCFALFDRTREAKAAAHALSEAHPHWWVKAVLVGH